MVLAKMHAFCERCNIKFIVQHFVKFFRAFLVEKNEAGTKHSSELKKPVKFYVE